MPAPIKDYQAARKYGRFLCRQTWQNIPDIEKTSTRAHAPCCRECYRSTPTRLPFFPPIFLPVTFICHLVPPYIIFDVPLRCLFCTLYPTSIFTYLTMFHYLQHDFFSGAQLRPVHLRHAGGRQRLGVDVLELLAYASAPSELPPVQRLHPQPSRGRLKKTTNRPS